MSATSYYSMWHYNYCCILNGYSAARRRRFRQVCRGHHWFTHHSVVHKVSARQFKFLLTYVETVDGVVAVSRVGRQDETGQLTAQILARSAAGTCTASQP